MTPKSETAELVKCRDCMDSQVCNHCKGDGSVMDSDGEQSGWVECEDCGGSGRCQWCDE
jgi:DnaJ-class molecular chaperone